MAEQLSVEQIKDISTQANDYDNWVINKRDPEQGPVYVIEPHIVSSLCDMALASLSSSKAEGMEAAAKICASMDDVVAPYRATHGYQFAAAIRSALRYINAPHPEDTCEECGRPNVIWFAPNPIWNETCGDSNDIICPVCFIQKANVAGFNKDAWKIQPEFYEDGDGPIRQSASELPQADGWVSVPVDLTQAMLDAGDKADSDYSSNRFGDGGHLSRYEFVYKAMLAAAPSQSERKE